MNSLMVFVYAFLLFYGKCHGSLAVQVFICGLEKTVEVQTVTGCRGKLWPADAGP